jgi:hypothetical protein
MARGHIEIIEAVEQPTLDLVQFGWTCDSTGHLLSRDDESEAVTMLLQLPRGYRRWAGTHEMTCELYILSGHMSIGHVVLGAGAYQLVPGGTMQGEWRADEGCTVWIKTDGSPNFLPAQGEQRPLPAPIDTATQDWILSPIPGPPCGLLLKPLRVDHETGSSTFLSGIVPQYHYPFIEYHRCVEECFLIRGDIRLGTSGLMTAGSYFYRPPYVSHGPFYSHAGMLGLLSTDGALDNHYISDPFRTPEQNMADSAHEAPATNLLRPTE